MGTNDELIIDYLQWLRHTKRRSAATLRSYGSALASLNDWLEYRQVLNATPEELEDWIGRQSVAGGPRSAASRTHDVAVLRQFFEYNVNRGRITLNPAKLLGTPGIANVNPRPIPDADWLRLWDSDLTLHERTALGLGYFAGLRRAEITSLQVGQVDPITRQFVNFVRKGGGEHVMPWGDCCDVLERLDVRANEFAGVLNECLTDAMGARLLLPWVDPDKMNRKMRAVVKRAGVSSTHTPHSLRHSFASNLLRCGVPLHLAQRMCNHSNPNVTMRYVRASGLELRSWLAEQS